MYIAPPYNYDFIYVSRLLGRSWALFVEITNQAKCCLCWEKTTTESAVKLFRAEYRTDKLNSHIAFSYKSNPCSIGGRRKCPLLPARGREKGRPWERGSLYWGVVVFFNIITLSGIVTHLIWGLKWRIWQAKIYFNTLKWTRQKWKSNNRSMWATNQNPKVITVFVVVF